MTPPNDVEARSISDSCCRWVHGRRHVRVLFFKLFLRKERPSYSLCFLFSVVSCWVAFVLL